MNNHSTDLDVIERGNVNIDAFFVYSLIRDIAEVSKYTRLSGKSFAFFIFLYDFFGIVLVYNISKKVNKKLNKTCITSDLFYLKSINLAKKFWH